MSRGSFGRSVARAAASGGGQAYRGRRPGGWYLILSAIVIVGVALVVYSRNERLHPVKASSAANGPSATDNWNAAFAIDICGKMQPALAANSNLGSVGIRTFGSGLINIDPGAVSSTGTPSSYEGKKATLALFVKNYPGLKLSSTELSLPGKKQKTWSNGTACINSAGPATGTGKLQIKLWSSPTAKGALTSSDPAALHLRNGQMITVAFVPVGTAIPAPSSKAALEALLGTTAQSSTTSSAVTSTSSAVTSTTTSHSSTTVGAVTATTAKK